jgi:hypothetical protein
MLFAYCNNKRRLLSLLQNVHGSPTLKGQMVVVKPTTKTAPKTDLPTWHDQKSFIAHFFTLTEHNPYISMGFLRWVEQIAKDLGSSDFNTSITTETMICWLHSINKSYFATLWLLSTTNVLQSKRVCGVQIVDAIYLSVRYRIFPYMWSRSNIWRATSGKKSLESEVKWLFEKTRISPATTMKMKIYGGWSMGIQSMPYNRWYPCK